VPFKVTSQWITITNVINLYHFRPL